MTSCGSETVVGQMQAIHFLYTLRTILRIWERAASLRRINALSAFKERIDDTSAIRGK
jgi:hypothetical protein